MAVTVRIKSSFQGFLVLLPFGKNGITLLVEMACAAVAQRTDVIAEDIQRVVFQQHAFMVFFIARTPATAVPGDDARRFRNHQSMAITVAQGKRQAAGAAVDDPATIALDLPDGEFIPEAGQAGQRTCHRIFGVDFTGAGHFDIALRRCRQFRGRDIGDLPVVFPAACPGPQTDAGRKHGQPGHAGAYSNQH